ncbi:MAG: hypothetical protein M0Q91_06145 [Methanoregula sp.]|jgi:hypothetical protein|nr:hypothetical protein [Methanoregula sp.]
MEYLHFKNYFISFVMLIAVICIIQPVSAQAGTMTISYRGSGGYYLGDTIIFDGRATVGNTTLLKITGPGLPSQGVPVYDLNGTPGSGNTVPMNTDGTWKFVWISANTKGIDKIVTARYTITAFEPANPKNTASASVFLKKPEFYINPQLTPIKPGDYIQLSGVAEQGVTSVKIDIADSTGKILHTYTAPVSGAGSFNYEFRGDMQPGQYFVSASNPAMKNTLTSIITVVASNDLSPVSTTPSPVSTPSENITVTTAPSSGLSQNVTTIPSAVPLSPFTIIAGLIFSGILVLMGSTGRRK